MKSERQIYDITDNGNLKKREIIQINLFTKREVESHMQKTYGKEGGTNWEVGMIHSNI